MRKILFRGKTLDNGERVYGYYVHQYGADEIYLFEPTDDFDSRHIDPNTVGECTGFTDKNGKEVFEGDIIHYYGICKPIIGMVQIDKADFTHERGVCIRFCDGSGVSLLTGGTDYLVVGNIHDNPKLAAEGLLWRKD